MNVSELMLRDPMTVSRNTPVQEITRLLTANNLAGIPVLDADGTVAGLITDLDLIVRHANLHLPLYLNVLDGFFPFRGERDFQEEVRRVLATRAEELMSTKVVTVSPDMDLADAATVMMDTRANPLLVVQDHRLVGVLTRADIVRLMVLEDQQAGGAS